MIKSAFLVLTLAGLGLAAPRFAAAEAAVAPAGFSNENFASDTVARLSESAHIREWDLASNNSNAGEIYATLIKAGGQPICKEKQLLVNSEYVTKQDCSVAARVARLTVIVNDIVWGSTTEVDVQGETACQAQWMAIARGRHQVAELWHFCQLKGVALSK
jgi:hypothetical protein